MYVIFNHSNVVPLWFMSNKHLLSEVLLVHNEWNVVMEIETSDVFVGFRDFPSIIRSHW